MQQPTNNEGGIQGRNHMFDKREWLGILSAAVVVMVGAALVAGEFADNQPKKKKCTGGLLQQTNCVHN